MTQEQIQEKILEMEERMIIEIKTIFAGDEAKEILFIKRHQMPVQAMFTIMQQELGTEETRQIIEMYLKFNKEMQEFANKLFTH